MQKKLTALLLVFIALTTPLLLSLAEGAESAAVLTAGTADASQAGDIVAIDISLEVCAGVDSLGFRVNYDPKALRLKLVDDGDLFSEPFLVKNTEIAGLIWVAAISAEGLSGAGTVMTLHFEVLGNTGSAIVLTDVELTRIDEAYNQSLPSETFAEAVDGGVSVGGAPLPAPVATPWPDFTPLPTPEPTPEPTQPPQTPEPAVQAPAVTDAPPVSTPEPEKKSFQLPQIELPLVIAGAVGLGALVLLVLLLTKGNNHNKKKAKRG